MHFSRISTHKKSVITKLHLNPCVELAKSGHIQPLKFNHNKKAAGIKPAAFNLFLLVFLFKIRHSHKLVVNRLNLSKHDIIRIKRALVCDTVGFHNRL